MRTSFKGSVALHLVLIALIVLLAYSNTFNAPFVFDDEFNIVKNPIIKDLRYFIEPSKAKSFTGFAEYPALRTRYMGFLSFALNYKIHGLDVTGFHITNLVIHLLNAMLVYFLVILTFRTPYLSGSLLREHSKLIALFTALVFVSHPVQTQAVTYIYQRLASLVTFFYLLSVLAYAGARVSTGNIRRYALYALALISTVLAMKTKENAFTLPVVIALYEFVFLSETLKRRLVYLFPFLVTMSIIPLTVIDMDRPFGEAIGEATRTLDVIPRWDYLLTQPRVIVTYLRLLLLPVNQNLDYDYPVFSSFFNPQVFLSFLFLLCLFSLLIYLYRRSRRTEAGLRLVAFGGLWFFITLSVESSVITLGNVIYEHRVYLPSAGAFTALTSGAFLLLEKLKNRRTKAIALSSFIMVLLVFSYAAYARNSVWRSQISLWEDVVRKSPRKTRPYNNLGVAYNEKGLYDRAIEYLNVAITLNPDYAEAHHNLGVSYEAKGLTDKAIEHYRIALRLNPDCENAHNNLALSYLSKGLIDKAIEHLQTALSLRPDYAGAHTNIGNAYLNKGITDKAIEHFQTALSLRPDYAMAHSNLGNAYYNIGQIDKAIEHLQTAVRLRPDYADAHNNLALAYWSKGLKNNAIKHFQTALRVRPDYAMAHSNLGNAYYNIGQIDKAAEHLQTAVRLRPDYADAHFNLGLVYLEKGIMNEAKKEFKEVLRISPGYQKARRYLNQTKGRQRR